MANSLIWVAAASTNWHNLWVDSVEVGIVFEVSSSQLKNCTLFFPFKCVDGITRVWFAHFLIHYTASLSCGPAVQPGFFEIVFQNLFDSIIATRFVKLLFFVPSLANLSANSFPLMFECPGIHCIVTWIS